MRTYPAESRHPCPKSSVDTAFPRTYHSRATWGHSIAARGTVSGSKQKKELSLTSPTHTFWNIRVDRCYGYALRLTRQYTIRARRHLNHYTTAVLTKKAHNFHKFITSSKLFTFVKNGVRKTMNKS